MRLSATLILLLISVAARAQQLNAAEIMLRVAANQDRSEAARTRYVYVQHAHTLTPMERTAFILRHMEDQPLQVIADALDIPVNSAKQAVFRAVAKLRRELAPSVSSAPPFSTRLAKESR